jgi:hypothetical protein
MAHRQHEHGGSQFHPFDYGGSPGQGQHGVEEQRGAGEFVAGTDDVLADPDVFQAQILAAFGWPIYEASRDRAFDP